MPSRTAGLTGRRPDTTRNYELVGQREYHRNVVNATTIPQFFKEQGYITFGCGKLFHYLPEEEVRYSWDPDYPSGLCTESGQSHPLTAVPPCARRQQPRPLYRTCSSRGLALNLQSV